MGANIFAPFIRPPRSIAEHSAAMDERDLMALRLQGQAGQNQLLQVTRQQQMQQAQQAMEERNALQKLAQQYGGDDAAFERALTTSGMPGLMSQAEAISKRRTDRTKAEADIREKDAKTAKSQSDLVDDSIKRYRGALDFIDTPQGAARWLQAQYADPVLGQHMQALGPLEQSLSRIPQDPQGFNQWRQQAGMGMEKWLQEQRARETQAETGRHNKATEKNQAGQLAVSQGQLGVAQGNLGVAQTNAQTAKERLEIDKTAPKGVYDAERGVVVDPRSATATPVTSAGQPLPPKQDAATKKELMSIGQQRALVQSAIADTEKTPSAFGLMRGVATLAGTVPESLAGRADSDAERQARAFVFNNVSSVINERAGAAQSAQELARLRSFLPAETDNSEQVVSKLKAFEKFLAEKERGTTPQKPAEKKPGGVPKKPGDSSQKMATVANDDDYAALPSGTTFVGPDGKTRRKP